MFRLRLRHKRKLLAKGTGACKQMSPRKRLCVNRTIPEFLDCGALSFDCDVRVDVHSNMIDLTDVFGAAYGGQRAAWLKMMQCKNNGVFNEIASPLHETLGLKPGDFDRIKWAETQRSNRGRARCIATRKACAQLIRWSAPKKVPVRVDYLCDMLESEHPLQMLQRVPASQAALDNVYIRDEML